MSEPSSHPSRRVIVLGSTGSIGVNTLRVMTHLAALPEDQRRLFDVVGLAAGSNAETLFQQATAFGVEHIALAQGDPPSPIGNLYRGARAAETLVESIAQPGDLVVAAMVGAAGIPAVLAAIRHGCDVALANKETLVAAGELVTSAARTHGVSIIPIDSEHSGVLQAMQSSGPRGDDIKRVVLTASGGPFHTWSSEKTSNASISDALAHPTWKMGPKVTIDSASLMNKGLELIEAHWLFGVDANRLDAVVHPQSIVHAFVEFTDGSVIAQLAPPDMRLPIQTALTWPDRLAGCTASIAFDSLGTLDFEPIDHARFPSINLARRVIEQGGTAGTMYNAANEVAVEAFLAGTINFGRISGIVLDTIDALNVHPADSLEAITAADDEARATARGYAALVS